MSSQDQNVDEDTGGVAVTTTAMVCFQGSGRPRKDIPRKLPTKSEISAVNLYIDTTGFTMERSRSGRKRSNVTVFHDEVGGEAS